VKGRRRYFLEARQVAVEDPRDRVSHWSRSICRGAGDETNGERGDGFPERRDDRRREEIGQLEVTSPPLRGSASEKQPKFEERCVPGADEQEDVFVGEEEGDVLEQAYGGEAQEIFGAHVTDALDCTADHPTDQRGEGRRG
jgi:hypothetical protein